MDEMAYLAMTGAKQTEYAQTINSNNLANISTSGFRADLHAFSSAPIQGPGIDSRINAIVETYGTDFSQGPVVHSGRDLDIAIQGRGFIAVQDAEGNEAYTRAGDLRRNPGGLLTNGAGHLVLGNGGPVAIPPDQSIYVGRDGTVTVRLIGQGPETVSIVDRIRLVDPDPDTLEKGSDGLFRTMDATEAPLGADVRVVPGSLEQSNVNVAVTLVNMIELSRQYEMQVNVIRTAKEDADAAAQMMRLG